MNDFNFFSLRFRNDRASRNRVAVIVLIISLILCIIGGTYFYTQMILKQLREDIASYEEILNSEKVRTNHIELEKAKKDMDILNRYYNAVIEASSTLKKEDVIKSILIEEINSLMPEKIMVKSFDMSAGSVNISASSQGRIPVAEFSHNLSSSGKFASVHVKNIANQLDNSDNFDFEIHCVFKDVIEE